MRRIPTPPRAAGQAPAPPAAAGGRFAPMNGSTLVIGAGTNLGGRRSILRAARDLVAWRFGVAVRVAPVWETAPMGPPQPDYLNTAFAIDFDGPLPAALERCLAVERALGRERRERWGPRTLDLDLLWHAANTCDSDALSVPHRGLRERAFALDPLLALVPGAVDPRDGARLAGVRRALPPSGAGTSLDAAGVGRADRLAAATEALAVAPATPSAALPVELGDLAGLDDDARLARWLDRVRALLAGGAFVPCRVAVLEDSDERVRAVLLGEPSALTTPRALQNT
jgi:2-amino-4-hydroxy-6-hydroxymethyldihydropteridine diphosphokinase